MKLKLITAVALLLVSTSMTQAAWSSQQVAEDYQSQGYTRIEVRLTQTQAKVEAIRGTEKIEVIYDLATGAVLKKQTETVKAGEDTTPGVFVRDEAGSTSSGGSDGGDDDSDDEDGNDDENDDSGSSGGDDRSDDHSDRDGGDDD